MTRWGDGGGASQRVVIAVGAVGYMISGFSGCYYAS